MKTVFKVGMEVYDSLNFPDQKGIIANINSEENTRYCVEVSFECVDNFRYFTLDGRFRAELMPTLSTKPYKIELKGFEQKAPAPTYEEVRKKMGNCVSITKNMELPNGFLCNAFGALAKLIWLRDYYNDGWQPNYKNKETKYTIYTCYDRVITESTFEISRILCFETEEIRDRFFEDQKELLEIAKPLL